MRNDFSLFNTFNTELDVHLHHYQERLQLRRRKQAKLMVLLNAKTLLLKDSNEIEWVGEYFH